MKQALPVCPDCGGERARLAIAMSAGKAFMLECPTCSGSGMVTPEFLERRAEGRRMREARVKRGVGLREEAERRGMLASDLCRMESGHIPAVWCDEDKPKDAI